MKVNNFTNEMGDVVQGPSGLTSYTTATAVVAAALATPAIVLGSAAAAGVATTIIRSDSTIAAFDVTVPTTSVATDAAAVGSVAFAARRDHRHGREGVGTPVQVGSTNAEGVATTIARSDHVHQGRDGEHVHIGNMTYSGDGTTVAFELPAAPVDAYSVAAYVNGARVDMTLSNAMLTTMTFGTAPTSGTDNIRVDIGAALA